MDEPPTAPADVASDSSGVPSRPGLGTTLAFAASLAVLAGLLTTSAQSPPPAEARLGQRVELVELIQQEEARSRSLQAQVEELSAEIRRIEEEMLQDHGELDELRDDVEALAAPAGLTPVVGPGVRVTLNDSTSTVPTGSDPNDYVIHEEDLQAVINALWAAGGEALSVNGYRVIGTTAIRCVGNVLLLHGATHSPPYVIDAIGPPDELAAHLERDVAVQRFARSVRDYKLGFDIALSADEPLRLPPYEGSIGLQEARPQDSARG